MDDRNCGSDDMDRANALSEIFRENSGGKRCLSPSANESTNAKRHHSQDEQNVWQENHNPLNADNSDEIVNFLDFPCSLNSQCENPDDFVCNEPETSVAASANAENLNQASSTQKNDNIVEANVTEEEILNIIEGFSSDIDALIEKGAEKNHLTARNVKCILKHVITNKYVLAMVRNTMKLEADVECELEEAVFEPKLTRAKAKELREKQAKLPWPINTASATSVLSTPGKQIHDDDTQQLLFEDFSDNENSSDEEYKPNDEDCHSGEEEFSFSDLLPSSSAVNDEASDGLPLIVAEPQSPEFIKNREAQLEADRIALRTRSKNPLTGTTLESIEASFIAPDITVDMYDTMIDDEEWQNFLNDFTKPLFDEKGSSEQPDDEGDDPEYNIMDEHADLDEEEEENKDEDQEECTITQDEMNALMAEIFDDMNDYDEDDEVQLVDSLMTGSEEVDGYIDESKLWIKSHERLQIEQQLRMHVQLLLQAFILSYGYTDFAKINEESAKLLYELKYLSMAKEQNGASSIFHAFNLDEAVTIVNSFRMQKIILTHFQKTHAMPSDARYVMASSKVFIYPDLLPIVPYQADLGNKISRPMFTNAEENLIVLGLDQFHWYPKPYEMLQQLLMPAKTTQQIKFRVKNRKSQSAPDDNPIKRYFQFQTLPVISRDVRQFDPSKVIPPRSMHMSVLPKWMHDYVRKSPYIPLAPSTSPSKSQFPIMKPLIQNTSTPMRKYSPILPRGYVPPSHKRKIAPLARKYTPILVQGYVSPLKKISPILRKYHNRRTVQMMPLNTLSPVKPKLKPIRPKLPVVPEKSTGMPEIQCLGTMDRSLYHDKTKISPMLKDNIDKYRSPPIQRRSTMSEVTDFSDGIDISEKDSLFDGLGQDITKDASAVDIDISEDVEDDGVDDEQDLAALMAASSTICRKNSVMKKKNKHQRDLESTLALLSPTLMESDPKKEDREKLFAQSYLLRVMEALKNEPEQCERFLKLLCTFEQSNKTSLQLFFEVNEILKDYPALVDDFVGFLLPEEAKDCGKYVQYKTLCKIREFLRKLETHFIHQPQHIQRILKTFSQLQQQADITSAPVIAALQPLLRNQSHLLEELMQLLPDSAPPECLMTDFENIQIPNSDGEYSCDSVEEIDIPETKDPYGGKDCPCECHASTTDIRMQNRSRHCVQCGTKFIDGRIYIQTGKVLKPAQVIYHDPKVVNRQNNNSMSDSKSDNSVVLAGCTTSFGSPPATIQIKNVSTPKSSVFSDNSESDKVSPENSLKKSSSSQNTPKRSFVIDGAPVLRLQSISQSPPLGACIPALPQDVTEDAVLFADSSSIPTSIPSDFSCLSQVISPKKNSDSFAASYKSVSNFEDNTTAESSGQSFASEPSQLNLTATDSTCASQELSWTREQDKLILETCQKHGVNTESFAAVAEVIPSRSAQQVQTRFNDLMDLVKKHLLASSCK